MKNKLFLLLLVCSVSLQMLAQATTEGKDFWLATTIVCQPPSASAAANPYIAVSAQKACTITISNYQGTQLATATVAAGSWTEFGNNANTNTNPATGPVNYTLSSASWYPSTNVTNTDDVYKHADETNNYGIHVTATEDVSVYVVIRAINSMDASNILPMTTLQSEYYVQDVYPESHGTEKELSMVTILATENNTTVAITPKGDTYGKSNNGQTFNITLQKGQTYYLMSKVNAQLAGTHIVAQGGKKIAVYQGAPLTRIPAGVSARDGLYEQAMPVDYWGTNFIVTRSMDKDGNYVGITAAEDGTTVKIGGYPATTLNAGDTYMILMQSAFNPYSKKPGDLPIPADHVYTEDALSIQTSCPCAVYSYDTGNGFVFSSSDNENKGSGDDRLGDPSSVIISPIEQRISKVTFGACYTDKTEMHYLNIVTETATCQNTTLTAYMGQLTRDDSQKLIWTPVPDNPTYSYARLLLTSKTPNISVFTLANPSGFVAHVYGNGDDESYAYSVGSSAVKRGVRIGENLLADGSVGASTYCINTPITFNAQVGSDIIDLANWNMGDGVTFNDGRISFDYIYDTPGWYDITARVSAHKICPETQYPAEDVSVRIRVVRPDTIRRNFFICEGESFEYAGFTYTEETTDTVAFDCDSISIFHLEVGKKSSYEFDTVAHDVFSWHGQNYEMSGDYEWVGTNASGCDSTVTAHVKVIACLDMNVLQPDSIICADDQQFTIPYTHRRGDIAEAYIENRGVRTAIEVAASDDHFIVPLRNFKADHYTNAAVVVIDENCEQELRFPVSFDVLYPTSVFAQKWDNVLALYNERYNGGYKFISYQWCKNGTPMEGEIGSYYHTDELDVNSTYSVILTRVDEASGDTIVLSSCPYTPVMTGIKNVQAHVNPTLVDGGQKITITAEGLSEVSMYSSMGNREQVASFENSIELVAPSRQGVYMIQVLTSDGQKQSFQVLVK